MREKVWMVACALGVALASAGCREPAPAPVGVEPGSAVRGKATLGVILKRDGDLEGPVRWKQATLVVSDVELHACEQARGRASGWSLVREAHAHVPGSAMRLGTPMAVDLLGEPGRAKIIGESAPPHVAICAMVIVLAPADDDVINTSALDGGELEGHTFVALGEREGGETVELRLAMRRVVRVAVPAGALVLKPGDSDVFALLEIPVSGALLQGLETMDSDQAAEALASRLEASVRLYGGGT